VEFSEKGWIGMFLVNDNSESDESDMKYGS
jgi:hypothetical protein